MRQLETNRERKLSERDHISSAKPPICKDLGSYADEKCGWDGDVTDCCCSNDPISAMRSASWSPFCWLRDIVSPASRNIWAMASGRQDQEPVHSGLGAREVNEVRPHVSVARVRASASGAGTLLRPFPNLWMLVLSSLCLWRLPTPCASVKKAQGQGKLQPVLTSA